MDIVGISRAGITLLLNEMEEKGLVFRESAGHSKRDKVVKLTGKGRDVLAWQYDRQLHAKITMKMVENIMDISERQLMSMPPFEDFDPLDKPGVPEILHPANQKAFVKMVQRLQ